MAITQVDTLTFLEFRYVIGRDEKQWYARAFDISRKTVAGPIAAPTRELAEERIRAELKAISTRYYGPEAAVARFRRIFPDGFSGRAHNAMERDYKWSVHLFVADALSAEAFSTRTPAELAKTIAAAFAKPKVTFLHRTEHMRLAEACKDTARHDVLVQRTRDLLYGDNFDLAFDAFVAHMARYDAAKWPICTFLPFFRHPTRHLLVKPSIVVAVADKMGSDIGYEPRPTSECYKRILRLLDELGRAAATLEPRDNIDLQSLMWSIEQPDYEEWVAEWRAKNTPAEGGAFGSA